MIQAARISFAALAFVFFAGPCVAQNLPGPGQEAPVVVQGYSGHLMEPFITRDGTLLFFNNRNDPAAETDLHVARAVDPVTFEYLGPIDSANTDNLDGVISLDEAGTMYWTAVHRYADTFQVLHRGRWDGERVHDIELVPGLVRGAGWLQFDAEISHSGSRMYLAEGYFGLGIVQQSDLYVAEAGGDGFTIDRDSGVFAAINTNGQEFAPALSRDELQLFFTRWRFLPFGRPQIWHASRPSIDAAFGSPTRLPIGGYVEAASLSPGEGHIYFHRKTDAGFRLFVFGLTNGSTQ